MKGRLMRRESILDLLKCNAFGKTFSVRWILGGWVLLDTLFSQNLGLTCLRIYCFYLKSSSIALGQHTAKYTTSQGKAVNWRRVRRTGSSSHVEWKTRRREKEDGWGWREKGAKKTMWKEERTTTCRVENVTVFMLWVLASRYRDMLYYRR